MKQNSMETQFQVLQGTNKAGRSTRPERVKCWPPEDSWLPPPPPPGSAVLGSRRGAAHMQDAHVFCLHRSRNNKHRPPPPPPRLEATRLTELRGGDVLLMLQGGRLMAGAPLTARGPFQPHGLPMSPGVSTPVCWGAAQVAFTTAQSCGCFFRMLLAQVTQNTLLLG